MTIDKALEAKILRYHFVEHWGPHTIAAQFGIHHSTVDRVLSQAGMPKASAHARPRSLIPTCPSSSRRWRNTRVVKKLIRVEISTS